ncbi:hypothetical protein [Martelella sp. AMO21009]
MSIDTGDLMSRAPKIERPLPPEVKFDMSLGRFSGSAEPGVTIKISNTADALTRSAVADAAGKWIIDLGREPTWYTIYRIWSYAPETGAASHTIQMSLGGSFAVMNNVYASEKSVFGLSEQGTVVAVYGPRGLLLGKVLVSSPSGAWAINFRESVHAGDRVCVIATLPNGNTSMPLFALVHAFSVNERSLTSVSGSGARPQDQVEIVDTATKVQIAQTQADGDGNWSVTFDELLESGTKLKVVRTHQDGSSSSGPVYTALPAPCLAPTIDRYEGSSLGGMAGAGQVVHYAQYRSQRRIADGTVQVDSHGNWSVDGDGGSNDAAVEASSTLVLQPGDVVRATTSSADNTQQSYVGASVTIGEGRPNTPVLSSIDQNGATGWGDSGTHVMVSTQSHGVICSADVIDGMWSVQWESYVGSLPTTTVVYFQATSSPSNYSFSPTSDYAARYADAASTPVDPPVILTYTGDKFAGLEATPSTAVYLKDDDNGQFVNPGGADVIRGEWSCSQLNTIGFLEPPDGDHVTGVAWVLGPDGSRVTSSDPSKPVIVDTYMPDPPTVTSATPTSVVGTETVSALYRANYANISIHIAEKANPSIPRGDATLRSDLSWTIAPIPPLHSGDKMIAWARTKAGNESTNRDFTVGSDIRPRPPTILQTGKTIGGAGVNGTTVELFLDGTSQGTQSVTGRAWSIPLLSGTPATNGQILSAQATNSSGAQSDFFYYEVGQDPTDLTLVSLSTTQATITVSDLNQTILGWRGSDGKKVIDTVLTGEGQQTVGYISGSKIADNDTIFISAQGPNANNEGTMTDYVAQTVPFN